MFGLLGETVSLCTSSHWKIHTSNVAPFFYNLQKSRWSTMDSTCFHVFSARKILALLLFVSWSSLVAISRHHLGVHSHAQILCGAVLGGAFGVFWYLLETWQLELGDFWTSIFICLLFLPLVHPENLGKTIGNLHFFLFWSTIGEYNVNICWPFSWPANRRRCSWRGSCKSFNEGSCTFGRLWTSLVRDILKNRRIKPEADE